MTYQIAKQNVGYHSLKAFAKSLLSASIIAKLPQLTFIKIKTS
jgi:hypothetical protein